MNRKLIIFLFFVILLASIVCSQPQNFQTNVIQETPALTIVFPKCDIIESDREKNMPFDVLNSSFARLTNETTACEFFMVDEFGGGIASGNLNYSQDLNYWHYNLNTTHTADNGCYSFYVHCNNSGIEFGFISEKITITSTGEAVENNLLPIILALVATIIFFSVIGYSMENSSKYKLGLKIASYSIALVEIVNMAFLLYLKESALPFNSMLKINFWIIFLISIGIAFIALIFLFMRALNLEDSMEDEDKKWQDRT